MDVLSIYEKIYLLLSYLAEGTYFFAPAYVANMAPTFLFFLKNKTPINERWLGKNKTWSGFAAGIILAIPTVWLQKDLSHVLFFDSISIIEYKEQSVVILGILFGAGALLGDSFKSLLKRRAGISSGAPWRPWDQIDFIFGSTLLLLPIFWVGWPQLIAGVLVALSFQPIVSIIGFRIGFKQVPW